MYVARTSNNRVISIVACCHGAKLCAHAARDFRSQNNTAKNFRAPSVFQGKRYLLKNSECKEYTPYSEKFLGNSVFQGKRKILETSE